MPLHFTLKVTLIGIYFLKDCMKGKFILKNIWWFKIIFRHLAKYTIIELRDYEQCV